MAVDSRSDLTQQSSLAKLRQGNIRLATRRHREPGSEPAPCLKSSMSPSIALVGNARPFEGPMVPSSHEGASSMATTSSTSVPPSCTLVGDTWAPITSLVDIRLRQLVGDA
eukprot:gene4878-34640_t